MPRGFQGSFPTLPPPGRPSKASLVVECNATLEAMAMLGLWTARRARQRAYAMTAAPYSDPPELQFRAALARRDIVPPDAPDHGREAAPSAIPSDAAARAMLPTCCTSMACRPAVFRTGVTGSAGRTGAPMIGRSFSPAEQEEYRRRVEAAAAEREADKTRRKAEAAGRARSIWKSCPRVQRASVPAPKALARTAPGFIGDRCS